MNAISTAQRANQRPATHPASPMTHARSAPGVPPADADLSPDYSRWSIEELRAFATQLQLPKAATMSRSELLDVFGVTRRT